MPTQTSNFRKLAKPHSTSSRVVQLKQVEHRSYGQAIQIYHYALHLMTLSEFKARLHQDAKPNAYGYVDTMIGVDGISFFQVPEGDVIPLGHIEVAHLPRIFSSPGRRGEKSGSALGFRIGNHKIEWLRFDRPIEAAVLGTWIWNPTSRKIDVVKNGAISADNHKMFDLVATMERGVQESGRRGPHAEHKAWFYSLKNSETKPGRLRLSYKRFEEDRQKDQEEQQMALSQGVKTPTSLAQRFDSLEQQQNDYANLAESPQISRASMSTGRSGRHMDVCADIEDSFEGTTQSNFSREGPMVSATLQNSLLNSPFPPPDALSVDVDNGRYVDDEEHGTHEQILTSPTTVDLGGGEYVDRGMNDLGL